MLLYLYLALIGDTCLHTTFLLRTRQNTILYILTYRQEGLRYVDSTANCLAMVNFQVDIDNWMSYVNENPH
jgi:hypothetical protein